MADEVDQIQDFQQLTTDKAIDKIRKQAAKIPRGEPGECHTCGEESLRLILGNCAPCRDAFKLP